MRRGLLLFALLLLAPVLGCNGSSAAPADAGVDAADPPPLGGDRPVPLFQTPDDWDGKTPLPLVMVLHGYGVGGIAQAVYFGLEPLVNEKQILLAAPDGTIDSSGKRFWNAVDTCCDFDHTGVDDVKYLTGLVDEIASRYPVDRKRVYLIGHSNGGAMSLRLACDATPTFAAVLDLAGPFWSDPPAKCSPSAPIALRVLHGTSDQSVPYDGGMADGDIIDTPSAPAVAAFFAAKNGCSPTPDESAPPVDLDTGIPGAETKITRYTGCPADGDVELWTIQGGTHIPALPLDFRETVWTFFSTHSR